MYAFYMHHPPRLATHRTRVAFRDLSLSLKHLLWKPKFLLGAPTKLGMCRPCVRMISACPWLRTRGNAVGRLLSGYTRRQDRSGEHVSQVSCLPLSQEVSFDVLLSSLPHPGVCVHGHPGEQASETPSV
jgi:hypothetical protein